jgi:plasmid stability protein
MCHVFFLDNICRPVAMSEVWVKKREDCMPDVRVRNLDEWVISELKDRARRHGNSLDKELRTLLTDEATRPRREVAERAAEIREAIRAEGGTLSDSTRYIREERDRV